MGLSYKLLLLLISYLSDRKNIVQFGKYSSYSFTSCFGVPQGSNLGPLIFIVIIIDLSLLLYCYHLFYADDVKLYLPIGNKGSCKALQSSLEISMQWCKANPLNLNASKYKIMSITRKNSVLVSPYSVNKQILKEVDV